MLLHHCGRSSDQVSAAASIFKAISYFFIVSLTVMTVVTLVKTRDTIDMIDTNGYSHDLTSATVFAPLGIGWAAFGLSLIFNILYYALHPSQVTMITSIYLQSSLISPPGRPAGHHREAGSGCVWL